MSRLCAPITSDQIDDFFSIGKEVKIQTVPRSKLGGKKLDPATGKAATYNEKPFIPPYKRRDSNPMSYAKEYKDKENEELLKAQLEEENGLDDGASTTTGGLEHLDSISMTTGMTDSTLAALPKGVTEEEANQVYSNYNFRTNYDKNLATYKHREEIINIVESNQVTVIKGQTGSGKTTQVPQYILDDYAAKNRYCNIVVTQPRRIAAQSIALRVCAERNWQPGRVCGYQIGMERTASEDTRLLFCTTGVLLMKLIGQKTMTEYTHVILDEVHERDQESDFCLLVVKQLLRKNSRDVKVILMSATIDCSLFADYFKVQVRNQLQPAPVCEIIGQSFAVQKYFLDDLKKLGEIPMQDPSTPKIDPMLYDLVKSLIMQFDNMEIQEHKKEIQGLSTKRGSVLVFLPGLVEIHDLHRTLNEIAVKYKLWLLPLHSTISGEEQARVFDKPGPGNRKVIMSTNIAESSITVSDIKYVIDFCLTKNLMADPETTYTSLQLQWASDSNCKQRQGRAGRVSDGRVYRLVTRRFYNEYIPDYGIPEMQRCPLDIVILKTKQLDFNEPKATLGLALSPPKLDDIECTILTLKEVGALASLPDGECNPHDGALTFVGRVLAELPLDIRLGKLILLGHVFGTLKECLIISAALSLKSFFATKYQSYLNGYRKKREWSDDSFSDCIAYLNAFQTWQHNTEMGLLSNVKYERDWANQSNIQIRRIKDVAKLVEELEKRLHKFNIRIPRQSQWQQQQSQQFRNSAEYHLILKVVLCGAFYPNFFSMGCLNEEEAHKDIAGHNPYNTVMIRGLPTNQGKLYQKQLEQIFVSCDERGQKPVFHFEETKAFVEFVRDPTQAHSTSKILPAVYMALKKKMVESQSLELTVLSPEVTRQKLEQLSLQQTSVSRQNRALRSNRYLEEVEFDEESEETLHDPQQVALPPPSISYINLMPTIVTECGSFWAHYADEDTVNKLSNLQEQINRHNVSSLQNLHPSHRSIGSLCLAPFHDEDDPVGGPPQYYRGRIEKLVHSRQIACVFFVDYGNVGEVPYHYLKELENVYRQLPLQAVEFRLCKVKPSAIKCPNGRWTSEAKNIFRDLLKKSLECYAQVYSIVHGILRVELYLEIGRPAPLHVNKKLVDDCYADDAEEDFRSKQNHRHREENSLSSTSQPLGMPKKVDDDVHFDTSGLGNISASGAITSVRKRNGKIQLSGPSSPYEVAFNSMTNIGRLRSCRIDRESVNCISLDDEPHTTYSRMMVAASVSLNPSGNVLQARDTTFMPNIPGLPALVALLFAPVVELRTDRAKKKYTGVLCGLGWDPTTGGPALGDHDMEITFDTTFDLEDLASVNAVRMAINIAIGSDDTSAEWGPDMVQQIHEQVRNKLFKLFKKRRQVVTPEVCSRPYRWNQYDVDDVIQVKMNKDIKVSDFMSLHQGLRLEESDSEDDEDSGNHPVSGRDSRSVTTATSGGAMASAYSTTSGATAHSVTESNGVIRSQRAPTMTQLIQEQKKHVQYLKQMANMTTQQREVMCMLCNYTAWTSRDLLIHLKTRRHRQLEETVMNQMV